MCDDVQYVRVHLSTLWSYGLTSAGLSTGDAWYFILSKTE